MKTLTFDSREEWLDARRGKITGSRLGDVITERGSGRKIGYYETLAERLGIPPDDESAMDRGLRLEPEAMQRFITETSKKVDTSLVLWLREDTEGIALSPDGFITPKKGKKVTEAVETKCLSSARHIEAFLTQQIPKEYRYQKLQYFIVNDDLQKLYFAFYDPRLLVKDFFIIEVTREEVGDEVKEYLERQREILTAIEEDIKKITEI